MIEKVKYLGSPLETCLADGGACPSLARDAGEGMSTSQQIQVYLLGIGERLRQHAAAVGHQFDFTPQQAMLLDRLGTRQTMGQVAAALHCDPSNVTGLIRRLEARGLVVREADEADRRTKWLVLTPAGNAARESFLHEMFQVTSVLDGLDDEGQEQLLAHLRVVGANLNADPACG